MSVGENITSTPDGAPADDRETIAEKSPVELTETVVCSDSPCRMLNALGTTEMSKSAWDITYNANDTECD
jgi:hypothetical protein